MILYLWKTLLCQKIEHYSLQNMTENLDANNSIVKLYLWDLQINANVLVKMQSPSL